jgi:UDP-N-acetylmuramoyl-L-alanyl-D-glutamate--2,6-diaminopimelate ligase
LDRQVPWETVVAAVAAHRFDGRPLTGITEDSRQVTAGSVFVARRGRTHDGHAFARRASAAGAALIVAEALCDAPTPQCVVPSAPAALSQLAALWNGEPARGLRLVGITGTNGKTTSAHLTAAVLQAAGISVFQLGTLGIWVEGARVSRHLLWTTPPAPVLHAQLAEMRAAGATAGVLEVSAQALDQRRVDDCPFEVAAVTGVSREHGEYFADQEAYRAAKRRLFSSERPAGPPAWSVVHTSIEADPTWNAHLPRRRLTYGPGAADVRAVGFVSRGLDGGSLEVDVRHGRRHHRMQAALALPGVHNVDNALCAVAVGLAMGVTPAAIVRGIESVPSVPGRLQHIVREPFRVLVDYAHNPAGLRAALSTVRRVTPGRLFLVMGARGERDRGKRPLMAAVAAALCDGVVLTSDQPAGEDPEAAAEPMRLTAADCGIPVRFIRNRREALETALSELRAGDSLIVAGKGDEEWRGDGEEAPGTTDISVLQALLRKGATQEGIASPAVRG